MLDIFEQIINKYKSPRQSASIRAHLGHGDAHHGNIILADNGEVFFFDNEYAGTLPVFMELSKPYYNDFLGALFFYFQNTLTSHFELINVKEEDTVVNIKIKPIKRLTSRLKLTEVKLNTRSKFTDGNRDFMTLNDYLFMCHTLTKDPNYYPEQVQWLFLAFAMIIADFDPFEPESIYRYF